MSDTTKIEVEDPANRQAKKRSIVPPPRIQRSLRLQFQGDWGRANLHRALGFFGYEFTGLAGPYTRYAIWNGRGGMDNVQAVGRGEVDIAPAPCRCRSCAWRWKGRSPAPARLSRICACSAMCRSTIA